MKFRLGFIHFIMGRIYYGVKPLNQVANQLLQHFLALFHDQDSGSTQATACLSDLLCIQNRFKVISCKMQAIGHEKEQRGLNLAPPNTVLLPLLQAQIGWALIFIIKAYFFSILPCKIFSPCEMMSIFFLLELITNWHQPCKYSFIFNGCKKVDFKKIGIHGQRAMLRGGGSLTVKNQKRKMAS